MIRVLYKSSFIRDYDDLSEALREEIREKIALFKSNPRQQSLRVQELKGHLQGRFSFSVNYSHRIVFCYEGKNTVALLAVGGHEVYQ